MADALATLVKLAPSLAKLATDLVSASDTAKRNAQLIEFQNALIGFQSLIASVQQENATLIREKRDAEEKLERIKAWETQQQRYQLVMPLTGCTVYALKESVSNGEAPHYLCANCFQEGKRSFLQLLKPKAGGYLHFVCAACKAEMDTRLNGVGPPQYAEKIRTNA